MCKYIAIHIVLLLIMSYPSTYSNRDYSNLTMKSFRGYRCYSSALSP